MPLDAASLRNAVSRLREGLERHRAEAADEQLRDGLIQRFEFTYELSHKMLRRYLQETSPSSEEAARMSFAELIRAGNAQGLLRAEWPTWRHFRDIRTRTTHPYDAGTASVVVAEIPAFLEEVEVSLRRIEQAVGTMARVTLLPEHRRLVQDLLAKHLSPDARVWVFGSRITGRAWRYSDLDLAIDAGRPLTLDETADLRDAFDESDLPYRVDIVDWCAISDAFRRVIAADRRPLLKNRAVL